MEGACTVEGIFVLLLVQSINVFVDSETSSFSMSFELATFRFEATEMIGVPGGRVSERDILGFYWSELVETGGESIVIGVDQVSRGNILGDGGVRDGVSP